MEKGGSYGDTWRKVVFMMTLGERFLFDRWFTQNTMDRFNNLFTGSQPPTLNLLFILFCHNCGERLGGILLTWKKTAALVFRCKLLVWHGPPHIVTIMLVLLILSHTVV